MRQHNHYFKDVSNLNEIDVYMVLKLFNVTDPCLQHIAKKALCAGQRGHKNFNRDLKDILDTAKMPVLDSTFQAFAKAGLGGLGLKLANFYKSLVGLDPIEAQRRSREFMKSLGDLDPIISQQKFLAEAGNEASAQTLAMLTGLRQQQASIQTTGSISSIMPLLRKLQRLIQEIGRAHV